MRAIIVQSSFWQLVSHADAMTIFVLLVLFCMSILCWTTFLYKLLVWRAKKKQLHTVIDQMSGAHSIDDVVSITGQYLATVPGYFLSKNLGCIKDLLLTSEATRQPLGQKEWMLFEQGADQTRDTIMYQEERVLPLISLCVTVAPLLGLLGTVWGLVNAFMGISHQQSADIAAVAPGIAQALVATVGGLLVAIPALFIYTYLSLQLQSLDQQIGMLSDRLKMVTQKLFIISQREG